MPALIAFRALQGLGAGAVQPTAMTIIGDIYSVAERARVQGYVASVWAISAVVGPTLGGYSSTSWIGGGSSSSTPAGPACGLVAVPEILEQVVRQAASHRRRRRGVARRGFIADHPRTPRGRHSVVLGLRAKHHHSRGRGVAHDRLCLRGAARSGILPGWIFRSQLLNSTNLAALGVGVMLIGLASFVPLYAQGCWARVP